MDKRVLYFRKRRIDYTPDIVFMLDQIAFDFSHLHNDAIALYFLLPTSMMPRFNTRPRYEMCAQCTSASAHSDHQYRTFNNVCSRNFRLENKQSSLYFIVIFNYEHILESFNFTPDRFPLTQKVNGRPNGKTGMSTNRKGCASVLLIDDCSSGLSLYLPLHISDNSSRQPYVTSNQPSAILN